LVAGRVEPATPYHGSDADGKPKCLPSPVQLTRIEKLSTDQNVDAVGLSDLLGDPLIKECWNFNFLFDLDFVMQVQYLPLISEAAVRLAL
jgi:tyrosyl-DNA phosphodiesterase-1